MMNLLRPGGKPDADTYNAVRDVLTLLQELFYTNVVVSEISPSGLLGIGHILGVCADALGDQGEEEGAAHDPR